MTRTRLWLVVAFVGLLAAAMVAAGCGDDDDEGDSGGRRRRDGGPGPDRRGRALVGHGHRRIPPFEIGRPAGHTRASTSSVMDAVAEEMGLDAEYHGQRLSTSSATAASGQFDTRGRGVDDHAGRARTRVDFSDPYYESEQSLLVAGRLGHRDDRRPDVRRDRRGPGRRRPARRTPTTRQTTRRSGGFPQGPRRHHALADRAGRRGDHRHRPVANGRGRRQGADSWSPRRLPTGELYGFPVAPGQPRARRGGQRGARDDQGGRDARRALPGVLPEGGAAGRCSTRRTRRARARSPASTIECKGGAAGAPLASR